jgi:methionyl-tRNA formyltransferase
VYFRSNFNDASFLQVVRESCADVIVIRVNQLLKSPLIDFPPKGVYCVHSSLLPAYRGIAGEFHAMWNGDSEIGSSLFRVELALDEGPVLRQVSFPIQHRRSVFSHMLENNRRAAELLRASLLELRETGKIEQQVSSFALEPSYFSWPTSERVREFRNRGGTLVRLRELWTILSPKVSSES